MANSGSITGSFNGSNAQYLKFRCDWSVTSQSTANKTSTVSLSWVVQKTTSNLNTYKQTTPWSQTCDSSTTNGTVNFNLSGVSVNTDYVVRTDTVTISHNANGTKTASISGTLDLSGTSAGVGSFSGSMELPTIATTPPTVSSLTISDQGTGYSTVGAYVAGFTKFKLTASASAASPATISSYAFYNGNTLLASGSSSTYTYSNYNSAGSYTFKVVVTDSYGNSTTKTNSAVTVSAYTTPTISATTFRCNSSGTADTAGAYASCKMTYSVASVGSNSAQVHKVKVGSLSDVTLTSGTPQTVGGSLSASTSYNAVYTVTDKFGTTATITQVIQSEFVNFDLYPSSSTGGVAFGQVAESGKFISTHRIYAKSKLTVQDSGNYPEIDFMLQGDSSRGGALTKTTGTSNNQFYFQQYHRSNGANTTYVDTYWLPASGTDSASHTYDILTTKNFAEIASTVVTSGVATASTSGITLSSQTWRRFGKVCVGTIAFYGTIGAGGNVDFSITSAWRSPQEVFGVGYYSQSPLIARMYANSATLRVRNASGTDRTATSSDPFIVSVTYIQ